MVFTDKLVPSPFRTVFGMHKLEYLSEFGSLSTVKSHSTLPSGTNKEIGRFTLTLTVFKPQVSYSFPVEVEKAGGPFHSFGRVITSPIPWLLVAVDFSPSLPSNC